MLVCFKYELLMNGMNKEKSDSKKTKIQLKKLKYFFFNRQYIKIFVLYIVECRILCVCSIVAFC